MNRVHGKTLLALVLVVAAVGACSDNSNQICGPFNKCSLPPPTLPPRLTYEFPSSQDLLVENFLKAYSHSDLKNYAEMLTPDFLMILQQSTIDSFPDLPTTIGYDEEIRIHERLFSGDPVVDPGGNIVPGVAEIFFPEFAQVGEWVQKDAGFVVPWAWVGLFDMQLHFTRPGFTDLVSAGQVELFVTSRDSLHQGVMQPYFAIAGQRDLTTGDGKGLSGLEWGSVKRSFR